uniref:Sugar phosphate transporter domain-containing protein n=1 Tax=Alexandrium monilatum TaxID=311494 RepID=A0A6T1DJV2_9DINO|mmetsp:Transcript_19368/g.58285  ORF Transcript_19368/g.58285 Transcript_19368/m.58285 type:complete len:448 (+) Transcript_19368:43-1386(+)
MSQLEAAKQQRQVGLLQFMCDAFEDQEDLAHESKYHLTRHIWSSAALVGVLALAYMAISTGLITFNKYLLHDGRFPFVIFLGVLHMSFSFLCNLALYRMCPALYPALTDPDRRVHIDRPLVLRVLLPIALCFGAQLVLSNMAFMHSSLAFLQMMKQSNVVLVYLFSLALALERFSWRRALVLVWIAGATGLTIRGELDFSPGGFAIQGVSMLCESLKLTLQNYSLSAAGHRLDALTFVMLVAPLVLLALLALLAVLRVLWPERPGALTMPPWSVVAQLWPLLLANGCLAFAMNVAHALLIKWSSAMTFILTGVIMKDVVIVVVGAMILDELLSPLQVAGFAMQLVAILVWSLMKVAPEFAMACPGEASRKAPGGWEELCVEEGKHTSPIVAKGATEGKHWREAGLALAQPARRPGSPSSRSSASTVPPVNEEDTSSSEAASHFGEGF